MAITPAMLARSGKELGEQTALFAYAADRANGRYAAPQALWALLFAIPNGGLRQKVTAANLKASGSKKGVPDICLPVARGGYFGLYIELKRVKVKGKQTAGKASQDQNQWIIDLQEQGYFACSVIGWRDAVHLIEWYLELPKTIIV